MGDRLDPTKTNNPPQAAIEVKPNAAVHIKTADTSPGKLNEMRWKDAGAPENKQRAEKAAADKQETDASEAAAKERYRQYYESQTAVNGCTFVGRWEGWQKPAVVEACNAHDVDYGRGGNEFHRFVADLKLGYRIAKSGAPTRALVTYSGVRSIGFAFFHYRGGGPLPVPEGK